MNASTDLYPAGEAYAEMDLVVRQLDDGSLTVAEDDSLPDEERVRVLATNEGLKAILLVADAPELTEGLSKAIDYLTKESGGDPSFVWKGGAVYCESELPWSVASSFPAPKLQLLYRGVLEQGGAEGEKLSRIARGTAEWMIVSRRGPGSQSHARSAVPPSFLPGAGQSGTEDRATLRYGGVDEVPGRAEVSAEEKRRPSEQAAVAAPPRTASQGAAVTKLIMGVCVVLALAVGAGLAVSSGGDPPEDTPTADVEPKPSDDTPPVEPDEPDEPDEPVEPVRIDLDAPDPPPVDPPPVRVEPPPLETGAGVWKAIGSADAQTRRDGVRAWVERRMYEEEGARKRLLETIDGRYDRLLNPLLTDHFEAHPVGVEEAMECLPLANLPLRRLLVRQLGAAPLNPSDAEIVAEMLAEQEETGDLLIELTLIKLGHPKPGAAVRLLQKRGPEWAVAGEGREVMEKLAMNDIGHVQPLVEHPDSKMRILACELLSAVGGKKALSMLTALLADGDERVRRRAVEGLQETNDPKTSWPLARRLASEEDDRTKSMIRDALSRLPAGDTAKYLRLLYKRGKVQDRLAAVMALHAQSRAEAVPGVVRALRDPELEVQLAAVKSLRALQKQPGLSDAVAQGLSEVRYAALKAQDRGLRKAASQLHYQISGRFPK